MARRPKKSQAASEAPKVKMAPSPLPAEEIYIDGIAGVLARPGVVKLECYRVMRVDSNDGAEVRTVTHRLVVPTAAFREIVRLAQNVAARRQEAAKSGETAETETG